MIRAIIVEDFPSHRESLLQELEHYCKDKVEVLSSEETIADAISLVREKEPDLVFLDIKFPGEKNGFDLIQETFDLAYHVIFVTAYDEYEERALQLSGAQYLLKSHTQEELVAAVDKVSYTLQFEVSKKEREMARRKETAAVLHNRSYPNNPIIGFPIGGAFETRMIKDITFCKSDGNYAYVHSIGQPVLHVNQSLKEITGRLKELDEFYLIHKQQLINVNQMELYKYEGRPNGPNGSYVFVKEYKDSLKVARERQEAFESYLDERGILPKK